MNAIDLADMTRARCEHPLRTEISDVDSLARRAIVCVNADQFPRISRMIKLKSSTDRRIGLWFWELSEFPDKFKRAFDHVDGSGLPANSPGPRSLPRRKKPVHIVTMPVPRFTTASHSKDDLGLPVGPHELPRELRFRLQLGRGRIRWVQSTRTREHSLPVTVHTDHQDAKRSAASGPIGATQGRGRVLVRTSCCRTVFFVLADVQSAEER